MAMPRTYRAAIVGFAHMHINDVAVHFAKHPQVAWAGAADTTPLVPERRVAPYTRQWNLDRLRQTLKLPAVYGDYRELLAKEKPDFVIVNSENARHPDVVEACAAAGVHACVEKPMAASMADALRMVRACEAAGTKLMVNWPVVWQPAVRHARQLLEEGAIGRVLEMTCRIGHTGPLGPSAAHAGVSETAATMSGPERAATWWHQQAAGGGALLDFCCYGAMLSRWYLGQPATAATALKANLDSTWGDAEDSAAILVRFPQAVVVLGGSWTTRHPGWPMGPVIFGTEGTMVVEFDRPDHLVRIERGGGRTQTVAAPPLPAGRATVAEEFIRHLETGEPLHPTVDPRFNLDAVAILDAGLRSARSGTLETVDGAAWCAGPPGRA
jgi:predicted dehydrogenase